MHFHDGELVIYSYPLSYIPSVRTLTLFRYAYFEPSHAS
jgi:hypothetical protein